MARALPDLIARIRLDSSGVQEGVGLLQGELSKSNVAIGAAAAVVGVVVGALVEASSKYLSLADSVHSYMRATGESAPVAGAQVQAFNELGVSGEAAEAGMIKFSKAIELTPKKLEALGIEVAHNAAGNVDLNASLINVIDAYNGTEDAALRNTIALTAFGKGGAAMLPILEAGSTKLRQLEADVRVVFTDADIEAAHKYELQQKQVQSSWNAMWQDIGQKILPAQAAVAESYLRNEYVSKRMDEANKDLNKSSELSATGQRQMAAEFARQFDASQAAATGLASYADAANQAAKAASDLAKQVDDAVSAEEASTNSGLAAERANLRVAESQDKINKAADAVAKALHKSGSDSDEYRSAVDNLSNALLDQKGSYLDAAGAAQKLAEDLAGPDASATDKATAGHAAYIAKLQEEVNNLTPGSPLRVYLEQYIGRMNAAADAARNAAQPVFAAAAAMAGRANVGGDRGARASGGPVLPNSVYTVGEQGPETLVMGPQGGTVIPNSGGGGGHSYNLTLVGAPVVNDPDGVRRMLQRMALIGAAY